MMTGTSEIENAFAGTSRRCNPAHRHIHRVSATDPHHDRNPSTSAGTWPVDRGPVLTTRTAAVVSSNRISAVDRHRVGWAVSSPVVPSGALGVARVGNVFARFTG